MFLFLFISYESCLLTFASCICKAVIPLLTAWIFTQKVHYYYYYYYVC